MFNTKIVQKFKTHILYSLTFVKNHAAYERILKKYRTAGQDTYNNKMAHAHCMQGN